MDDYLILNDDNYWECLLCYKAFSLRNSATRHYFSAHRSKIEQLPTDDD